MFRRKSSTPTGLLPYGLREDLAAAGDKLVNRARVFHAAFGKDADSHVKSFLAECRLSVLVFLTRKGALNPPDYEAYGSAFPNDDLEADMRALLPRANMRKLGQSFVTARQRGITKAGDTQFSESERHTLAPLWDIIEHLEVLPGNRYAKAYTIGEQGRIREQFRELHRNAPEPRAPRNPTVVEGAPARPQAASTPEAPVTPAQPSSAAPSPWAPALTERPPQPSRHEEPAFTRAPTELESAEPAAPETEPQGRPAAEIYDQFAWTDVFRERTADLEEGRFFLPSALLPTIDQAKLRLRSSQILLQQVGRAANLQQELASVRRYHMFLLGAFFTGGVGVTMRDLRILARVLDIEDGYLTLEGWRLLGSAVREAPSLAHVAEFVPDAFLAIRTRIGRETGETFMTSVVEGALILMDVLLALGADDDGTRAAFRRHVYGAHLDRARSYAHDTNRRVRELLQPTPEVPEDLLGRVLGERFQKLPATLQALGFSAARQERIESDFARHFMMMFAACVRQPRAPHFYRQAVAIMNRMSGEQRGAAEWHEWYELALPQYLGDPFAGEPQYLRDLLHAAAGNSAYRTMLQKLLGTTQNVIVTFIQDVMGAAGLERANDGFARLTALVDERIGPAPEAPPEASPVASVAPVDASPVTSAEPPRTEPSPQFPASDGVAENAPEHAADAPADSRSAPVEPDGTTSAASEAEPFPLPFLAGVEEVSSPPPPPSAPRPAVISAPQESESLDDVLREVNELVGLDTVKREIQQLVSVLKVRELRRKSGLPVPEVSPHLVFLGPAGAGKTTVARLLGRMYRSIGFLKRGHLVDVDYTHLTGDSLATTTQLVQGLLDEALGGVLLVDRAYELAGHDHVGREAIGQLLQFMEDHHENIVIVIAGEAEATEAFLNSNPELRYRFTKVLHFSAYAPEELVRIIEAQATTLGYRLSPEAVGAAELTLEMRLDEVASAAGTREAAHLLEQALARHANRVALLPDPTADDLVRLDADDFSLDPSY